MFIITVATIYLRLFINCPTSSDSTGVLNPELTRWGRESKSLHHLVAVKSV